MCSTLELCCTAIFLGYTLLAPTINHATQTDRGVLTKHCNPNTGQPHATPDRFLYRPSGSLIRYALALPRYIIIGSICVEFPIYGNSKSCSKHTKPTKLCRQLILDGQWEDCLEFIQPLATLQTFQYSQFQYLILKHKFCELLCIKGEVPLASTETAVDEVVKVLKEIEGVAPSKEEYSQLCLLLTLNKLTDHPDYKVNSRDKAVLELFV